PLIDLTAGSSLLVANDLMKLQTAKLTGALLPADALVKLDASTLTISNGVLANLTNSLLDLTGTTLLSLTGGSSVSIGATLNNFDAGALLRVAGGAVFKMTGGSLISFGSGTNTVTISNPSDIANCAGCTLPAIS